MPGVQWYNTKRGGAHQEDRGQEKVLLRREASSEVTGKRWNQRPTLPRFSRFQALAEPRALARLFRIGVRPHF